MERILKKILDTIEMRSFNTTHEFFLKKKFKYYDLNDSGSLKESDFLKALKSMGMRLNHEESKKLIEFYKDP